MQGFLLKVYKKPAQPLVEFPRTAIYLHGDNSFAASDSTPLSFRVKFGVDLVSMGAFSTLVNNLVGNLDPVSSPE